MKKTLLSLLTAGIFLTTSLSNASVNPYRDYESEELRPFTQNLGEFHQKLYPDLRGNNIVSFEFGKFQNYPVIYVQYDTDKNGFVIYTHKISKITPSKVFLSDPFAVTIDENGNKKSDKGETTYLMGRTSEHSELETDTKELYPVLKGDFITSIKFDQFPRGLVVYIQFNTDDDEFADIKYGYMVDNIISDIFFLPDPFIVVIDRNRDHNFEPTPNEMFFLEERIIEEPLSEKKISECPIIERGICT